MFCEESRNVTNLSYEKYLQINWSINVLQPFKISIARAYKLQLCVKADLSCFSDYANADFL